MSDTTGDRQTADEDVHLPGRVIAIGVAIGLGYLVAVGVGMWFLPDIAAAVASLVGEEPLVQRLAGWAVWGVFLLAVALVFLRAARHQREGTRTSTAGRWWTALALAVLAVPGFVTFGGRGGPDAQTSDALDLVGPDFALGVLIGRFGAVAVVFVFLGLLVLRRRAVADSADQTSALLRTPAYAALGVAALTLVASVLLDAGP